jgi:hypothetical protein
VNEFTIGGGADVCVSILSRSSWQYQRTAVDVHERGGGRAWHKLASMEFRGLSLSGHQRQALPRSICERGRCDAPGILHSR